MVKIVWEEPEGRSRGVRASRYHWAEIAEQLKSKPGEWAMVGENLPLGSGTYINMGRIRAFQPSGSFEATTRGRTEDGKAKKVYARYIG